MKKRILVVLAAALCAGGAMAHTSSYYHRNCPVGYVNKNHGCVSVKRINREGYSREDYRRYERLQRENVSPQDYAAHQSLERLQRLQNPGGNS